MQIKVTGHHISVTPAMEEMVKQKMATIMKHFDHINSCHVVLSLDNKHSERSHKGHSNHKAEAIIRVPGQELFAHAECDDMYECINKLTQKLDRQVVKFKEKVKTHATQRPPLQDAI